MKTRCLPARLPSAGRLRGRHRHPVPIPASGTSDSWWTGWRWTGSSATGSPSRGFPCRRSDSRRLDRAYAPDERRLVLTLTEKGLNRLQDWLNDATDDGTPAGKNVTIIARDNQSELLARWEFTGVNPVTFSSAAAGNVNQVDSTVEFAFDRMRLVEARGK